MLIYLFSWQLHSLRLFLHLPSHIINLLVARLVENQYFKSKIYSRIMSTSTGEGVNLSSPTSAHPFRLFSLAEIEYATKNFDDELVIGQGGFGKVFKGYISSEEVVAIKRLDSMSDQGEPEFRAEINMLSKLRHCHLVSLIGYCHENNEKILVYEY
ncbi:putative protein kinase RLK-Pelle-CrRLK1L-1 family [Helianthus annuus]|nr:putative protein kinase RLK-Pelle-CrRLK1L-1 family [Helianthus annuus]KAJ0891526.1 putative protein kinase RLK-Pelle-CrRLK1L-1 family [Helianthus annuus]